MNVWEAAPATTLNDLEALFKSIPDLFMIALPLMAILTIAELIVSYRHNHENYNKHETLGTIGVGIGTGIVSLYSKVVILYLLLWIYNLVPWRMHFSWWTLIPAYVVMDFCNYWAHRISHQQRLWWATHIVHHSSQTFNLTVSFRLSWLEFFKVIFLLPVALLGFHPVIIFIASQISSLYQFWVHTEYIPKLHPWIEAVFVTPSSHRVHHGSQQKYINKNYGSTFIIWDRLFKTFQHEEEKPVFGITTNISSRTNPIHINFHEFADMVKDVRQAKDLRSKLFFIFGDPIEISQKKKTENLNS